EPSGFTGNPEIPIATSIMDYIFRWLRLRFVDKRTLPASSAHVLLPSPAVAETGPSVERRTEGTESSDAPFCVHCGTLTKRNGACFSCGNCGMSTGCG